MLATRIIPCLDIADARVVKGVRFQMLQSLGDPIERAQFYEEQGADEIMLLDVNASYKNRDLMFELISRVAKRIFIPLCVGGGIRDIEDMRMALMSGADKVAICTGAIMNPGLITEGAKRFGSQCIVLSIDAKRYKDTWHCYTYGGRRDTGLDVLEWARLSEELGAGEILLNSIDRDGTGEGYDLELTKMVSEEVSIPIIASGGAGNLEHLYDAIIRGRADAVLLASLVHYDEYQIGEIKDYLRTRGIRVR
ncbi:imidazole glycerol phosphate synthase subunit HisF [candidate division WOR-3 bacterium 4484_100]|uniref:Imidazole glycerol phosphate synthase subunit HisF n=1 Tax=candidate division WOR-3 bacterium 4484_100 TaxID=1936077 RepID=A0A1V4QGV6_UNCW3|nr:MAG: imidazole glycerol phosphate synthase subunit HisF [candidate division WOR-3 bacterium 4484_100]